MIYGVWASASGPGIEITYLHTASSALPVIFSGGLFGLLVFLGLLLVPFFFCLLPHVIPSVRGSSNCCTYICICVIELLELELTDCASRGLRSTNIHSMIEGEAATCYIDTVHHRSSPVSVH